MDKLIVIGDLYAGIGQVGIVERLEGVELVGTLLRRAVAAHQVAVEVDTHLGHHRRAVLPFGCGHLNAGDKVFLAIGAQLANGQLRAGKDDGLRQVLEHERQGRGGVGHRVGAVEHNEAVVLVVVVGNDMGQLGPERRRHIAGIDRRVELVGGDVEVRGERRGARGELLQLGHAAEQVLEVKRLQGTRLRVAVHAYCPASIYQKNLRCHIH